MGRHAASGSDGLVGGNGQDAGGRRRTDGPDALWAGAAPVGDSTSPGPDRRIPDPRAGAGAPSRPPVRPVLAPEARAVRVPSPAMGRSPRLSDDAGPAARAAVRPRPPVPVPPLPPRPSATPSAPVARHDVLPPRQVGTVLDDRPSIADLLRDIPVPARPVLSQPVPELPSRPVPGWSDGDHEAPWSTGRGVLRAPRGPVSPPENPPFVERRASRLPAGGPRPASAPGDTPVYGDWTKPSGPGRIASSAPVPPLPVAPLTSAIPDRDVSGRRPADDLDDRYDDDRYDDEQYDDRAEDDRYDDRLEDDRLDDDRLEDDRLEDDRLEDDRFEDDRLDERAAGPITGTIVGGRAAMRAERQAADTARRKADRRAGRPSSLRDLEEPRRPRRLLTGLVAVAAVAAGIVGVYTVITPGAEEAAAGSSASASASSAPTSAPATPSELPPLDTDATLVDPAPATPVRVPVTVLNSTDVEGLAARISSEIQGNGEGWKTGEPGPYDGGDIAATTVYFTEGDEKQRQAALQLVEQFPELQGPVVRFFEVPAELGATGLVVVAAGDWQP